MNDMASERKRARMMEEESTDISIARDKKNMTVFMPTNVILEVEGQQFHLNKECLAEKSPVFKLMFESEFKEKNMSSIKLPAKTWVAFQQFLCSFYFNETLCSIKEDTVLNILPLAEEYQIKSVKDRCEAFITKSLQSARKKRLNLETYLAYLECVELYNLSTALPIARKRGTQYTIKELKDAGIEKKVSTEMRAAIYEERSQLLESFSEDFVKDILKILSMSNGSRAVFEKYESILKVAVTLFPSLISDIETVLQLIKLGELYSSKKLLSSAVSLTSGFTTDELWESECFWDISLETREKIRPDIS